MPSVRINSLTLQGFRSFGRQAQSLTLTAPIAAIYANNSQGKTSLAEAIEFLPLAFGLGQPVGDGVDGGRMMTEAAMTAFDLDVLDLWPLSLDAALPGTYAVRPAEDRRRWY